MLKRLRYKYLAIILFAFLCIFGAGFIHTDTSYAYTNIPTKNLKKIATFKLKHSNAHQGGVITEKYFVYLDCSNHCSSGGQAVIIDRDNCQLVKKVDLAKRYLSGPSYKWGSNSVSLISKGNRVGCIKLDGKKSKRTSSGCYQPEGAVLNSPGSPQGAPANFNGYRFKVAGLHTPTALGVFKGSSTNKVAEFRIPEKYGEPEGVSIDGKTGEVYIDFDKKNPRRVLYYKINYDKLQKYTGKKQSSNPVKCSAIGKIDGSSSSSNDNSKDDNTSGGGSSAGGTAGNHNIPYEQPDSPGYDGSVHTNFFGDFQDDGTGCGVYMLLNFAIEILTYGIAILATIGIIVVGITYMTAKDNPAQVVKAKRRLVDIILGLITYVLLWSILNFVLPGGNFNNSTECSEATSSHGLFDTEPVEIRPVTIKSNSGGGSNGTKSKDQKNMTPAQRIVANAKAFAWPTKQRKRASHSYGDSQCFSSYNSFGYARPTKAYFQALQKQKHKKKLCGRTGFGADCGVFVTTVVRSSGNYDMKYGKFESYFKKSKKWKQVSSSHAKAGDICGGKVGGGFHTRVYLGKNKVAEAQHHGNMFGHIRKGNCKGYPYTFRAIK